MDKNGEKICNIVDTLIQMLHKTGDVVTEAKIIRYCMHHSTLVKQNPPQRHT